MSKKKNPTRMRALVFKNIRLRWSLDGSMYLEKRNTKGHVSFHPGLEYGAIVVHFRTKGNKPAEEKFSFTHADLTELWNDRQDAIVELFMSVHASFLWKPVNLVNLASRGWRAVPMSRGQAHHADEMIDVLAPVVPDFRSKAEARAPQITGLDDEAAAELMSITIAAAKNPKEVKMGLLLSPMGEGQLFTNMGHGPVALGDHESHAREFMDGLIAVLSSHPVGVRLVDEVRRLPAWIGDRLGITEADWT